ncbi:hypothetical protein ACFVFH_15430 [Streptomyces sp. NPDC057697]|uniref:MmyB family transcriptional regulator n=1 Tax=Streptomyces sp. NPDC057697 TaxID=3346219 RepID=UPI00368DF9C7
MDSTPPAAPPPRGGSDAEDHRTRTIRELDKGSPEVREGWRQYEVRAGHNGWKRLWHPRLGVGCRRANGGGDPAGRWPARREGGARRVRGSRRGRRAVPRA